MFIFDTGTFTLDTLWTFPIFKNRLNRADATDASFKAYEEASHRKTAGMWRGSENW